MSLPNPTVLLLVEDDPSLRRALVRVLNSARLSVIAHGTHSQALAEPKVFDCAVLDIDLPDGSGLDLAAELVKRGVTELVIFYSGTRDPEIIASAKRLGVFVPKSMGNDALAERIQELLKDRRDLAVNDKPALRAPSSKSGTRTKSDS